MGIKINLVILESGSGAAGFVPNCLCHICKKLLENVVAIGTCSHHFCGLCINKWIESNATTDKDVGIIPCPECGQLFNVAILNESPRFITNVLSGFKIKCESCGLIGSYDDMNLHKQVCLYSSTVCTFCHKSILQKELETHEDGCSGYLKHENSLLKNKATMLKTALNIANEKGFIRSLILCFFLPYSIVWNVFILCIVYCVY